MFFSKYEIYAKVAKDKKTKEEKAEMSVVDEGPPRRRWEVQTGSHVSNANLKSKHKCCWILPKSWARAGASYIRNVLKKAKTALASGKKLTTDETKKWRPVYEEPIMVIGKRVGDQGQALSCLRSLAGDDVEPPLQQSSGVAVPATSIVNTFVTHDRLAFVAAMLYRVPAIIFNWQVQKPDVLEKGAFIIYQANLDTLGEQLKRLQDEYKEMNKQIAELHEKTPPLNLAGLLTTVQTKISEWDGVLAGVANKYPDDTTGWGTTPVDINDKYKDMLRDFYKLLSKKEVIDQLKAAPSAPDRPDTPPAAAAAAAAAAKDESDDTLAAHIKTLGNYIKTQQEYIDKARAIVSAEETAAAKEPAAWDRYGTKYVETILKDIYICGPNFGTKWTTTRARVGKKTQKASAEIAIKSKYEEYTGTEMLSKIIETLDEGDKNLVKNKFVNLFKALVGKVSEPPAADKKEVKEGRTWWMAHLITYIMDKIDGGAAAVVDSTTATAWEKITGSSPGRKGGGGSMKGGNKSIGTQLFVGDEIIRGYISLFLYTVVNGKIKYKLETKDEETLTTETFNPAILSKAIEYIDRTILPNNATIVDICVSAEEKITAPATCSADGKTRRAWEGSPQESLLDGGDRLDVTPEGNGSAERETWVYNAAKEDKKTQEDSSGGLIFDDADDDLSSVLHIGKLEDIEKIVGERLAFAGPAIGNYFQQQERKAKAGADERPTDADDVVWFFGGAEKAPIFITDDGAKAIYEQPPSPPSSPRTG